MLRGPNVFCALSGLAAVRADGRGNLLRDLTQVAREDVQAASEFNLIVHHPPTIAETISSITYVNIKGAIRNRRHIGHL